MPQQTHTFWFREQEQVIRYHLLTPEELRECMPSTPDEYLYNPPFECFANVCQDKPMLTVDCSDLEGIESGLYCSLACVEYDATFIGD